MNDQGTVDDDTFADTLRTGYGGDDDATQLRSLATVDSRMMRRMREHRRRQSEAATRRGGRDETTGGGGGREGSRGGGRGGGGSSSSSRASSSSLRRGPGPGSSRGGGERRGGGGGNGNDSPPARRPLSTTKTLLLISGVVTLFKTGFVELWYEGERLNSLRGSEEAIDRDNYLSHGGNGGRDGQRRNLVATEAYADGDDDGGLTGNDPLELRFLRAMEGEAGGIASAEGSTIETERRLAGADEGPPSERYFKEALERTATGGRRPAAESDARQRASEGYGAAPSERLPSSERHLREESEGRGPAAGEGPSLSAPAHFAPVGASASEIDADNAATDGGDDHGRIAPPASGEEYLKTLAGAPVEPREGEGRGESDPRTHPEELERPREEDRSPYKSDHVTQQEQERLEERQDSSPYVPDQGMQQEEEWLPQRPDPSPYVPQQPPIEESPPYDEDEDEPPIEAGLREAQKHLESLYVGQHADALRQPRYASQQQAPIEESRPEGTVVGERPEEPHADPREGLQQPNPSDQGMRLEQEGEGQERQAPVAGSPSDSDAEGAVDGERPEPPAEAEPQEGLCQQDPSDRQTGQEQEDEDGEPRPLYVQEQAPVVGTQSHPDAEGTMYEKSESQQTAEPQEGFLRRDQSNQREQLEQQSPYYVQQQAVSAESQLAESQRDHSLNQFDQQSPQEQQQQQEQEPAYDEQEDSIAESRPHPAEGDSVGDPQAREERLGANQFSALSDQQPQLEGQERPQPQQEQQAPYEQVHQTQQEQQEQPPPFIQQQAPVAESPQRTTDGNVVVDRHAQQEPPDRKELSRARQEEDRSPDRSAQRPPPVQRKQPEQRKRPQGGPRLSYAEKQQALAALYQAQHQT